MIQIDDITEKLRRLIEKRHIAKESESKAKNIIKEIKKKEPTKADCKPVRIKRIKKIKKKEPIYEDFKLVKIKREIEK